jgi:drug/metabolite transporter (DMT)-like permease
MRAGGARDRGAAIAADLSLLAITAVWGFTFTAVKQALGAADPFSFLAVRFALAAAVLLAVFPRRVFRVTARGAALAALIGVWLTLGYALQTTGLVYTTASKSAFITGLSVVLVPVLSLAISRVRPGLASVGAVALAAIGLYLLTASSVAQAGSVRPDGVNVGDLLTLGCAAGFALHIVTAERVAPRYDPVPLAFWQIVITAIVCGLIAAASPARRLDLTPWALSALIVTGVLATAVAFLVQMWAQRRTSATHVAVIFTAEPVFAALFSWLIQHEVLGPRGLLGGGLILCAVLVAQVGPRRGPVGAEGLVPGRE